MKYDVIMPVVAQDVEIVNNFYGWLKRYLPMKRLVLIGNAGLREKLQALENDEIVYCDEDMLLPYSEVKRVIANRQGEDSEAVSRTGWYLQQFLKMKYAYICQDTYYLIWDSDTVPIRKVSLWEEDHPVFHLKSEYYESYFDTMRKLLPGLDRKIQKSYIAEHMLINCGVMKELIEKIESNEQVPGTQFYEKIIYAIAEQYLAQSGFSEFETYGNYCTQEYPELYLLRDWRSLRDANKFFDHQSFGEREREWVEKSYDAVSFEKMIHKIYGYQVFHDPRLQRLFSFETLKGILIVYQIFARRMHGKGRK